MSRTAYGFASSKFISIKNNQGNTLHNIGRDTSALTVKGKKIYDVPGDEKATIQGSAVRGFTYTTGDGQYTTYQNPNVEIDKDTGKPISTGVVISPFDQKVKPFFQLPDGTRGVDL